MKLLGTPTRSDVIGLSTEYALAVELYDVREELEDFRKVILQGFPYQHLNEAYRDAGRLSDIADEQDFSETPRRAVNRKVGRLLNPDLVRDHYLAIIGKLRATLQRSRVYIDRLVDVPADRTLGVDLRSYPHCDIRSNDDGRTWVYQFNPYVVATDILDAFEARVIDAHNKRVQKFTQIMRMAIAAIATDRSYLLTILMRGFDQIVGYPPSAYEQQVGNSINEPYRRNAYITHVSDIALTFDERHISTRLGSTRGTFTSGCILDPTVRMHHSALSNRVGLRDTIGELMGHQGFVIINGIRYTYDTFKHKGTLHIGYFAAGESYIEIVNLLGVSVLQSNGRVIEPESWARAEAELVLEYRGEDKTEAREELLKRYNLDASAGHPTRQRLIAQLDHVLQMS